MSFRLRCLDKFQAITLTREISRATYEPHPRSNQFIGSIVINENLDTLDDLNIFYVRQQIKLEDCDILVKVISAEPIAQVHLPQSVNKLLKHIDCRITVETCKPTF